MKLGAKIKKIIDKKQINPFKTFLLNKRLKIFKNLFFKKIKNCIHKYMQFNILFRTN